MSATALIPLTCYTHPNNQQSLLKYPNVICGTDTHGAMLAIGVSLLIVGVFGFLSLCTFAAYMVPTWSAREQHGRVRAFRFLVFRFRPLCRAMASSDLLPDTGGWGCWSSHRSQRLRQA